MKTTLFSPIVPSSETDNQINPNAAIFRKLRNLETQHISRIIYIENIKKNLLIEQPIESQIFFLI